MSFANSHHFTIENLTAVDGSGGKELRALAQAACLGAGHQSEERFDAPKCHPETRKAVMDNIMSWVNSNDSKEPMMWMSGPAVAGKSEIAQTVCERCYEEGKLLASFFFSRSAVGTGRDDGNRLVATIAIQLAITLPDTKGLVIKALESNPALLSYSMEVQMVKLVLDPYTLVSMPEYSEVVEGRERFPYLVVIDGLDECNNPQMQARIITMISTLLSTAPNTSLRFLFASRPELEIRNTFNSPAVSKRCAQIILNEKYNPDNDIRAYLQSEFSSLIRGHHLKSLRSQESQWPSSFEIDWMVKKSSGQFIYASTIMKYLKHPRRDPRAVLASIISTNIEDIQTKLKESPYSELDALYRHILRTATTNFQNENDSIINVFQALLFAFEKWSYDIRLPSNLTQFLSMDQDVLEILLSDLHSILFIPEFVQGFHQGYSGKGLLDSRPPRFYVRPSISPLAESPTSE